MELLAGRGYFGPRRGRPHCCSLHWGPGNRRRPWQPPFSLAVVDLGAGVGRPHAAADSSTELCSDGSVGVLAVGIVGAALFGAARPGSWGLLLAGRERGFHDHRGVCVDAAGDANGMVGLETAMGFQG